MIEVRVGACSYREDVIDYILLKGKVSETEIIQKFKDCNDITLRMSVEKTRSIYENQGCNGTYITYKDRFYIVSNE